MHWNAPPVELFWPAYISVVAPLTNDETYALNQYQGVDYSAINLALRSSRAFIKRFGSRRFAEVSRLTGLLDTALNKCRLKHPVVVYRGLNMPLLDIKKARRLSGTIFQDPGFTSTSLDPTHAAIFTNSTLMRIVLPTGSRAISMDTIEDIGEKELLLARNGRFRILSTGELLTKAQEHGTKSRQIVLTLYLLPEY